MRKIFVALIIFAAMIVGGCGENISVVNVDNEIQITAENVETAETNSKIKIGDGDVLFGEAKIEQGIFEMKIRDKVYSFDKTQDISIQLPLGEHDIFFGGRGKFTGEVTLHTLPKI